MTKLSKIIYGIMLVVCLTVIIMGIIEENYQHVISEFGLLCWVGVAFMNELRCIKIQKQIDKLNGNDYTKS
jgi:hypothetical protein